MVRLPPANATSAPQYAEDGNPLPPVVRIRTWVAYWIQVAGAPMLPSLAFGPEGSVSPRASR